LFFWEIMLRRKVMKKIALLIVLMILILIQLACRTVMGEPTATAEPEVVSPSTPLVEPTSPAEPEVEASNTPIIEPTEPAPTEVPPEPTSAPTEKIEPTASEPEPTSESVEPPPTELPPAPPPGEMPPQTNAAEIRPPGRRDDLIVLSNLMGFQVLDINGESLGVVPDYIINTCETYIIYFVQEPGGVLEPSPGNRLIVPFEAVTINNGYLDAEAQAIGLHLTADHFTAAPRFPESMPLLPSTWEPQVWAYWPQYVRLGVLTTECNVPSSDGSLVVVQKIAYASELLIAELQDALQETLGTVQEILIEPESGKMHFFVVELADGSGFVLIPPGVVNIPEWALEPGNEITLVLLAENEMLFNAPRADSLEEAASGSARQAAWDYWAAYR
jgi:sporulation protein YlmC with PRC-barrel domain